MKLSIAAITMAAALGACTDAEMIQQAHGQCDQIGYPKGSPQYTECVERGFRGTKSAQDTAVAATTSAVLTAAVISAMW